MKRLLMWTLACEDQQADDDENDWGYGDYLDSLARYLYLDESTMTTNRSGQASRYVAEESGHDADRARQNDMWIVLDDNALNEADPD